MKYQHIILSFIITLLFSSFESHAQKSKRKSPTETISINQSGVTIDMTYSRPYKKGRLIFGTKEEDALVVFGEKWRTGANEATEITFSAPVIVEG